MPNEIIKHTPFDPMVEKYSMASPAEVMNILKLTVLKGTSRYQPTDADCAAFAIVCNAYDLNPFKREIHGFCDPDKGVVPIVGIDGWATIVNRRAEYDGCSFDDVKSDDDWGITCTIFVKGRAQPTKVTEWYKECVRDTIPWRMKRRMLRHKSFIQCARLAFGLGGIFDEDEARDIVGIITAADGTQVIPAGTPVAAPTRTEQALKAMGGTPAASTPAVAAPATTEPAADPPKPAGKPKKGTKAAEAPTKPAEKREPQVDDLPSDSSDASPTVNPAGETADEAGGEAAGSKEPEPAAEVPAIIDERVGELVVMLSGLLKGMDPKVKKPYLGGVMRFGGFQPLAKLEDDGIFEDLQAFLVRWCEIHRVCAGDQTLMPEDGFKRVAAIMLECDARAEAVADDSQFAFIKKCAKNCTDWGAMLAKHGSAIPPVVKK